MKKLLTVILFALLTAGLSAAEFKLAVLDMQKVFREYERTKVVEKKLQAQMDMFKEYSIKLSAQYKNMKKEFEDLRDASQDNLALTEAERTNRAMRAKDLYEQILLKEEEIKNYNRSRQDQIRESYEKMRMEILTEIRSVIRNRAAAEGFELVLDSSPAQNDVGAVVYSVPKLDITDSVLADLNRLYKKNNPADKTPAATPAK